MILDKIIQKRKERYEETEKRVPLEEVKQKALVLPKKENIRFYHLLEEKPFIYICECKKASPSKGIIREPYNYLDIAKAYEENGADCISCLTEPDFFSGSITHLKEICKNVSLPILRKDFIFREYQIYESRLAGADIVLLICAVLDKPTLKRLIELTHFLSMGCIVEAHSEEEIDMAIACGARVIGVNNRNLKDFQVDMSLSIKLRKEYPDIVLISESGIRSKEDIKVIKEAGLNGVLMGEVLMRSENIGGTLRELRHEG